MKNAILEVRHQVRSLSPVQAECWFTVVAEQVTATTEIRGRVVGPQCAGRTTIEVAYPLQRLPHVPEGTPPLTVRAVIPDPSLWETESPFRYRAHVELWQDGERCDEKELQLGFKTRE